MRKTGQLLRVETYEIVSKSRYCEIFMRLSPKQKFFVTVAATALLLGCSLAALWWMYQRIYTTKALSSAVALKVANRVSERKHRELFAAVLERNKNDLDRLTKLLVDPASPLQLIEDLESLAAQTRNTVTIDIEEAHDASSKFMTVRLGVSGTEDHVRKLIKLLEYSPYYLTIASIDFHRVDAPVFYATSPGSMPVRNAAVHVNLSLNVKTL